MIRAALIAGLVQAGAPASAQQGAMAEALAACGGTRVVLASVLGDGEEITAAEMDRAEEVLNARLGGGFLLDYVDPGEAGRLVISLPGSTVEAESFADILVRGEFTFHDVLDEGAAGLQVAQREDPEFVLTLDPEPLMDQAALANVEATFDQNGQAAVNFRLSPEGARRFSEITAERIGKPIAIVYEGEVLTVPVIQSPIHGGLGIITGNFSVEEATELAVILRSGALPVDLEIETLEQVEGAADGDAALCPRTQ